MTVFQERVVRDAMLRQWAKGNLPTMAAIDFLIRVDQVPAKYIINDGTVWFDFGTLEEDLEAGRAGYLSGGEVATLRLAVSLYNGELDKYFWRIDGDRKEAFILALINHRS